MKRISKSALKARMLEHLRRVEETGEELVVTDRGQPVLRIVPIRHRTPAAELFAGLRGRVVYHGDLLAPSTGEWPET
jgi:prevent-host-death family protein